MSKVVDRNIKLRLESLYRKLGHEREVEEGADVVYCMLHLLEKLVDKVLEND